MYIERGCKCKALRFSLYHIIYLERCVFTMFYLGIDIGKFSSVATLIDEKGTGTSKEAAAWVDTA